MNVSTTSALAMRGSDWAEATVTPTPTATASATAEAAPAPGREPVQQYSWLGRFGPMLVEVRADAIYVNGQRVEQVQPGA
jgi:hypothetical protein